MARGSPVHACDLTMVAWDLVVPTVVMQEAMAAWACRVCSCALARCPPVSRLVARRSKERPASKSCHAPRNRLARANVSFVPWLILNRERCAAPSLP